MCRFCFWISFSEQSINHSTKLCLLDLWEDCGVCVDMVEDDEQLYNECDDDWSVGSCFLVVVFVIKTIIAKERMFKYSLMPKNTLRAKMQQTKKLIAVRAIAGSLETFMAATRYKMIRTISSSPVQSSSDAWECKACGRFRWKSVALDSLTIWKFSTLEGRGATATRREEQCRPDQPGEWEQLQWIEECAFQRDIWQLHQGATAFHLNHQDIQECQLIET